MKLSFIRTLQGVGGSISSSIPSTITDALELKKGEKVKWNIDFKSNPPKVTFEKIEE